ncbi:MAG: ribosome biogenesis GTP-binding protein YihA/YsxC [Rhodothermales bacterium]
MDIQSVTFVGGATKLGHMPEDGLPEIAFIGRSNVGKSSLINAFLKRKALARTSSTPGKTQEINFFRVNDTYYVVDLPGFGYAKVSKAHRAAWQKLIGAYLTGRDTLRVVFQLVDSRHEPTALDKEVMILLRESPAEHVVVLTKADKLSGNERQKSVSRVRKAMLSLGMERPVVLTSAHDGRGRNELMDWLDQLLG